MENFEILLEFLLTVMCDSLNSVCAGVSWAVQHLAICLAAAVFQTVVRQSVMRRHRQPLADPLGLEEFRAHVP